MIYAYERFTFSLFFSDSAVWFWIISLSLNHTPTRANLVWDWCVWGNIFSADICFIPPLHADDLLKAMPC